MWKQVGFAVAVLLAGLGTTRAEARFGKHSSGSSHSGGSHSGGGWGSSHPSTGYYRSPRYSGYYGYYYGPGYSYFYDPSWAWPYVGVGAYPYYRPYGWRYSDLYWRRPRLVPTTPGVEEEADTAPRVDFTADAGLVSQGLVMGMGMQIDGQRFGLGAHLNMLNLATDDGSPGRDHIALLAIKPSILLVSTKNVRVRVSGGLDVAFAPDVTMVGPGLGTSAMLRLVGPLMLEGNANWTPLPFTQLSAEAGLALELGPARLRGGYRAIYLNDQGRVDGNVNQETFQGPYAGLALML